MASTDRDADLAKVKAAVKNMFYGATLTGGVGAVWGAFLATARNESVKFYSASMGANFFLVSSTFLAMEEIIADKRGKRDLTTGAASGGLTGGFYATLVGGRLRGLQGAAAGAAVGAAVIFGREQFHKWRLTKAVERYEQKYGTAPAVYYPNTDILVETKSPSRELRFPSLLPSSIKVTDEEIERRIQARVEELRRQEEEEEDKEGKAPASTDSN
ncbi:hypothetical protein Poli38472_000807 [Pythium oligandrum]|uniref:Uncharacterized protein n=1 Tax=Pythium oligandrum TaxID=41045 RepID=A0A8K1FEP4_PYTOL|nr:hypothetical protein Poli38472_000807 [Pythium oligandrum]|eukprot:TMW60765.1 hypothetical protein Poli38472_000807 [Pythium oligandrum]